MKRIFIISMAVIAFLLACGQKETSSEGVQTKKPVRVKADTTVLHLAVTPTLDCLPLFVAKDQGLFSHEGVRVSLKMYQAQMDQDTAVVRGRVEGLMTDLVRAEYLQRKTHTRLQYVSATDASWQMVTYKNARIKQKRHLQDKMIAMSRYSATDLLADIVIAEASLDSGNVFKIQINDVAIRLGMLQNGIMDALLLPEPQATAARQLGSPVLFDAKEADLRMGVLAFRQDIMGNSYRQQQVEAVKKAYNAACDTINRRGVRSFGDIIVKYCGVKAVVVDSLPKDIKYQHVQSPRQSDIERAQRWLDGQNKR